MTEQHDQDGVGETESFTAVLPDDVEALACARRGGPTIHREERFGAIGRGPVRIASMRVALSMLDELL